MPYTVFAEEVPVLELPNHEALVYAKMSTGYGYVAVTRDGYRTDYPLLGPDGVVRWDHPEWFTEGFRRRAARYIVRHSTAA